MLSLLSMLPAASIKEAVLQPTVSWTAEDQLPSVKDVQRSFDEEKSRAAQLRSRKYKKMDSSTGSGTPSTVAELEASLGCDKWVFGFSTGYCGTTTASDPLEYMSNDRNINDVFFTFEQGALEGSTPDIQTQEKWVHEQYVPAVMEDKRKQNQMAASTCVDVSHGTTQFHEGLVTVLSPRSRIEFVRIRRSEPETALSFLSAESDWDGHDGNSSIGNWAFQIQDPVSRMKVPTPWVADDLTVYQKNLWVIDETEVRWQEFKHNTLEPRGIPYMELAWSSRPSGQLINGSINRMFDRVAKSVGLNPNNVSTLLDKPHTTPEEHKRLPVPYKQAAQMAEYHKIMMHSGTYRSYFGYRAGQTAWGGTGTSASPYSHEIVHGIDMPAYTGL